MSTISINKSKVEKGFVTLYIRVRVDKRNISVSKYQTKTKSMGQGS